MLTSDLHKLALDATEEGADVDSLEPDIAAIFAHGGIKLALEALAFDIGPAKVEGTGQITRCRPTPGTARRMSWRPASTT